MIVKNEEEVLARCLKSTENLFDEIIIVDTGSTDKTKEIAKTFTPKVFDFAWVNDFSAARNFSFSQATGDYIMWLDADDVIAAEQLKKLQNLKKRLDGSTDCYMLKYAISFDANNNPTFVYYRERILKNDKTFVWKDPVHEVIATHGKIKHVNIQIEHRKTKSDGTKRNTEIYEALILQGKTLTPRQQFYYSRELYYSKRYDDAITEFKKFINSPHGWVENKIESYLNIAKCYAQTNNYNQALKYLFESFVLSVPRAEILCEIGRVFIQLKKYDDAIYWFKKATQCKINDKSGAFVLTESYNLIPNLQLCYVYYLKNNLKLSKKYHEKAKQINSNHPSVIHNENFFNKIMPQI